MEAMTFDGVHRWGHMKRMSNGYIKVYAPKHPHASRDGYVLQHRLVVERNIGRFLTENEVVHHENGDKTDNRFENLRVMTTSEHCAFHMKKLNEKRRKAK